MAIVSRLTPETASKSTARMPAVDPLVLSIVANLRRAGKGVRLVIGDGSTIDDGLVALIARAIATREMFFASDDDSVESMATWLGVRRDYLAVQMRLSYLAPEIVRAILLGAHPCELTPTRLVALSRNLPYDWEAQRRLLGFAPDGRDPALQQRSTSDGPKTGRRDPCSVSPP